jgi:hypothetical protein
MELHSHLSRLHPFRKLAAQVSEMRHTANFHPEWGYLAPTPSAIRTARIVLVATAVGVVLGAGAGFSRVSHQPRALGGSAYVGPSYRNGIGGSQHTSSGDTGERSVLSRKSVADGQ